jgi:hypothetical protein
MENQRLRIAGRAMTYKKLATPKIGLCSVSGSSRAVDHLCGANGLHPVWSRELTPPLFVLPSVERGQTIKDQCPTQRLGCLNLRPADVTAVKAGKGVLEVLHPAQIEQDCSRDELIARRLPQVRTL